MLRTISRTLPRDQRQNSFIDGKVLCATRISQSLNITETSLVSRELARGERRRRRQFGWLLWSDNDKIEGRMTVLTMYILPAWQIYFWLLFLSGRKVTAFLRKILAEKRQPQIPWLRRLASLWIIDLEGCGISSSSLGVTRGALFGLCFRTRGLTFRGLLLFLCLLFRHAHRHHVLGISAKRLRGALQLKRSTLTWKFFIDEGVFNSRNTFVFKFDETKSAN